MNERNIHHSETRLDTVQAGRGVASVVVVVYHVCSIFALPKYAGKVIWDGWFEIAKHGVDFFFVLSGFIIYFAHEKDIDRPLSIPTYVRRRFARIYPIYWIYLTLFLVLVALGFSRADVSSSNLDLLSAYTLIRLSSNKPPLWVAWSLFHEIVFYAAFLVLLYRRALGVILFCLWMIVILVFQETRGPVNPTFLSVFYDTLNIQFLMGIVVALLFRRLSGPLGASVLVVGILVLSLTAYFEHGYGYSSSPKSITLSYGLAFALALLGITALERRGWVTVPRPMKALGDATFTTYLVHGMMISVIWRALAKPVSRSTFASSTVPLFISAMIVVVCYVLYLLVEKPLLSSLSRKKRTLVIDAKTAA